MPADEPFPQPNNLRADCTHSGRHLLKEGGISEYRPSLRHSEKSSAYISKDGITRYAFKLLGDVGYSTLEIGRIQDVPPEPTVSIIPDTRTCLMTSWFSPLKRKTHRRSTAESAEEDYTESTWAHWRIFGAVTFLSLNGRRCVPNRRAPPSL